MKEKYEITYPQEDISQKEIDEAIIFAVKDCIGSGNTINKIFEKVKENTLTLHILGSKTVQEIADRHQELVKCKKCLPLEEVAASTTLVDKDKALDKIVEQELASPTVEDKDKALDTEQKVPSPTVEDKEQPASTTLEEKDKALDTEQKVPSPTLEDKDKVLDTEQKVPSPTVEDKEQPVVHTLKNLKPPKVWSSEEDKALIALVKENQSRDITVTQVFEEVKNSMAVTHILHSRSAEALGTHYRKLISDNKCPLLRGSIAARKGGHAVKKRVEVVTGKNSAGGGVDVPRRKRTGSNAGTASNTGTASNGGTGSNAGTASNTGTGSNGGPRMGPREYAAMEVLFEYIAAKAAHKNSKKGDIFPKPKDAE